MRIKLLAIDDCKIIRQTVAHTLRDYDCAIMEACDGVAGLAIAKRERPDVILLDYNMPVMDGSETLARLRAHPDLKATPVIMLTAEARRPSVVKVAQLGVRDYLLKPFDRRVLIEKLSRLVTLKTKAENGVKPKRVNDPIHILVADDKPAGAEQIRAGLTGTPWKVTGAGDIEHALGLCLAQEVDLVLASLELPKEGAHILFQDLRGHAATAGIPVFGLCAKTAVGDPASSQGAGLHGVLTVPVDFSELKTKVCGALKLEPSYQYFQQRDGTLVLTLPKDFHPGVAQEVNSGLGGQLTATVNAGGDKFIVDLTSVPTATPPVMELLLAAIKACGERSLRHALVGSDTIRKECQGNKEAANWPFASDFEKAVGLLK